MRTNRTSTGQCQLIIPDSCGYHTSFLSRFPILRLKDCYFCNDLLTHIIIKSLWKQAVLDIRCFDVVRHFSLGFETIFNTNLRGFQPGYRDKVSVVSPFITFINL